MDYVSATGLDKTNKCTKEEWDKVLSDESGDPEALKKELKENHQSHKELGKKKQLDRQMLRGRKLSVMKGSKLMEFTALFEAGLKIGSGTEEEREVVRKALVRLGPEDERLARD